MKNHDGLPKMNKIEKLKLENDILHAKLTAEFGMSKIDSSLPADAENDWLNYMYEFEKSFAENKMIKVYELIDKPEFRGLEQIEKKDVKSELQRLLNLMEGKNVILDILGEYEDEIIYKFITEELFTEETQDIFVEGMKVHFIYEEFHPNHEMDLKDYTENFFKFYFAPDWDPEYYSSSFSKIVIYHGKETERNNLISALISYREEVKPVEMELIEFHDVNFNIEKRIGFTKGQVSFSVLDNGKPFAHVTGEFAINFFYDEFEFWVMKEITFPEFGES